MQTMTYIGVFFAAYLIGSIPFGYLIVKFTNGKDIRQVESGRIGGTNAMRAAGILAGLLTVLLDFSKGVLAVWLARLVIPGNPWILIGASLAAILGHNYSVYLLEFDRKRGLRLRGGAGGATCVGGSFGLWPPSLLIILPIAALVWFGIGYASVTTLSVALLTILIFAYRAWLGLNPWIYVLYGLIAEIILIWALRPNIKRLLKGTERLHGWRAIRLHKAASKVTPSDH
ncbi:MAG: glycerol-3-phosphate acyltransferase [Chloroflexi bacterium]|nr:glycerol-3-phosphate acyltransferase [Chloroflexota bacterium]